MKHINKVSVIKAQDEIVCDTFEGILANPVECIKEIIGKPAAE